MVRLCYGIIASAGFVILMKKFREVYLFGFVLGASTDDTRILLFASHYVT